MAVDQALVEAAGAERAADALAIQHELGLPETARLVELRQKRGQAGRPPGARNKRSEEVARYVIETLGDPLVHLAAIATMRIDELAAALGCSAFEAAQERRLAAAVVLPFLHRKQPMAIDVTGRSVVYLTIHDGPPAAPQTENGQVVEVVEYQEVSEDAGDAV